MPRYFMEVSYRGDRYSGFQVQKNANTVQAEIEKALHVFFRTNFELTGSSRTDAGVHALQNFFHFDFEAGTSVNWQQDIYRLNAILPSDIVIKKVFLVEPGAHCRFDARRRTYEYTVYQTKNPFIADGAYYYPYPLNLGLMNEAAAALTGLHNFQAFSKRNTQVKSFDCQIFESTWLQTEDRILYRVSANRFLRGMVKGLAGTMLRLGRGTISFPDFQRIMRSRDCSKVDFSVDAKGLVLVGVGW